MTQEQEPTRFEKPEWVNADFYRRDPRAWQLRDISLRCANIFGILLNLDENETVEEEAYLFAMLEAYNGQLIGLGITEPLQENEPLREIFLDPVRAAEHTAKIVQRMMQYDVPLLDDAMKRMFEEFGEIRLSGMAIYRNAFDQLPPRLNSFLTLNWGVGIVYDYLDPSQEEQDTSFT